MRFTTMLLLLALAAGLGWCTLFLPYYIDAWKMEDVAGTAVLSWANINRARGEGILKHGLKDRDIPDYLTPDNCDFYEEADGLKTVDCAWFADVTIPVVDHTRRMHFRVVKSASKDGRLVD